MVNRKEITKKTLWSLVFLTIVFLALAWEVSKYFYLGVAGAIGFLIFALYDKYLK
jgi:hypothetical protein